MYRLILLVASIVCQLQSFVMTEGLYTIVTPGTIHPNALYTAVVSVQDITDTCQVKMILEGPNFKKEKEVEVPPRTTVSVDFKIPDIATGEYRLNVEGLSGLIFTNSTTLNFDDNKPSVFIQTDKAKYKPGDLVQFRVVFLDHNIRPATVDEPITIFIKDAAKNRIKQFQNITLNNGVITNTLQLSEFPILGEWEIVITYNGESIARKNFDVEEYVLPKFEVVLDTPKKALLSDEKFGFTVRSKYTFGKGVAGKAVVKLISRGLAHRQYPMPQPYPYPRPYPRFGDDDINPYIHIPQFGNGFNQKELQKTIDINGKAFVEFEINDMKPEGLSEPTAMDTKVLVIVEEELTGNKRNATSEVQFVWNRFEISAPNKEIDCTIPEKKFMYYVTISDLDGRPVFDNKHVVNFRSSYSNSSMSSYLNTEGIASFEINCSGKRYGGVEIEYRDQKAFGQITEIVPSEVAYHSGVYVRPKNPEINSDMDIMVKSDDILPSFVYVILGRGNIIKSEFVDLAGKNTRTHKFNVMVTFDMVPTAYIYVYYMKDKNLKFHQTTVNIKKRFINKISIDAPKQAKPGEDVMVNVATDPGSYVGLMAVDQSVLLLKTGNDFDKKEILDTLNNLKTKTPKKYTESRDPYPGDKSGVITLTNAHYPHRKYAQYFDDGFIQFRGYAAAMPQYLHAFPRTGSLSPGSAMSYASHSLPTLPPPTANAIQPRIRKDFSESWFIADFPNSGDNNLTISKKIPDTITSWIISGFSLNSKSGFALSEIPAKIQTFRPFFVTTNLPYSVKRGEVVTIPVLVFNYMDQPLEVTVTLDNSDGDFRFNDAVVDQKERVLSVTVSSNNADLVNFVIKPERIGQITLKITAVSHIAGDAIHKKLKVEPEGITVFENRDFYVQTADGQTFTEKLILDIPKEVVPDSEHIEISLMGDMLGSTVSNFDKLVRMPSGCGEQNMINFVPNILVLLYLESIKQLSPPIEAKAKRYLEIGYQRELTYKHDNGSYSAFGKSDKSGSTWLTAYVIRSFHQAGRYIDIEKKVLNEGLEFLASIQSANGSFPEYGKVLDFSHFNEVGLTAFVLLAFLENTELLPKYKSTLENGFKFLEENVKKTDDLYALSIAVYALQLHKSSVVPDILAKFDVEARIDGGRKWWTKSVSETRTDQSWRPKSHDVEITGYILMTLLDKQQSVLPITKWLISQRNSNGGFASTQETVVGLQALIKFAEKNGADGADLTIDFEAGSEEKSKYKSTLEVNKQKTLEIITEVLPQWVREVTVTGKGSGTAVLQISYRYNIALKDKKPSFNLHTKMKPKSTLQKLEMEVCAEYNPQENEVNEKQSNMVLMEVNLPSGYTAESESFENIKRVDSVKRVETKNGETNVVVYFDGMEAAKLVCIPMQAERVHEVSDQKPAPVVIYDYYDNQKRATEFYSI